MDDLFVRSQKFPQLVVEVTCVCNTGKNNDDDEK
jgi:hypothetical protein